MSDILVKKNTVENIKNKDVSENSKNKSIMINEINFNVENLEQLVTDNYEFNYDVIIEILKSSKFDDVLFYLLDKASYDLSLQAINAKNKSELIQLLPVQNNEMIVGEVACNYSYCFTSLVLTNNQSWPELNIDGNKLIKGLSFSTVDDLNASRQLFVYSIDERINSMVRTRR